MTYGLIPKPTFTSQLLGLPRDIGYQVLGKVELLRDDPKPDGKLKKKLHGYKEDLYRLRSGDYRVVYTYAEGWVWLLTVDNRKDIYKGERLVAGGTDAPPARGSEIDELLDRWGANHHGKTNGPVEPSEYLPRKIDAALLARLRVPEQYFAALEVCRTLDDLVNADVPDSIREHVFDVVGSPDPDQVVKQPDFQPVDVSDLVRFVEGELLGFLLRLSPEQERVARWAVEGSGPTLVKGGPGTGKSTVALYRVRTMVDALRAAGNERPRILFTTYTNALVAFSQQLLQRLLGSDVGCVEVRTADSMVTSIVSELGPRKRVADDRELEEALTAAISRAEYGGTGLERRARARLIAGLSHAYLLEEFGAIIEARELQSLDEYLATKRAGRRVPLNANQRAAVWAVYEAFAQTLDRRGLTTWHRLRRQAVEAVRSGHGPHPYDGVVIDEVQDLDPTVLRLLVLVCAAPNRLFVTADANQSIYGSTFRWADVHEDLQFRGRTEILRTNYRSTRQIDEAAHSYVQNGILDPKEGEKAYSESGLQPVVYEATSSGDESGVLASFLPAAARSFQLGRDACAVLVPTANVGRAIAERLAAAGIDAAFMPGSELDLQRRAVKIITLKSAKGLEFPIVALAGFVENPHFGVQREGEAGEQEERLLRERRSMYVGMTRAMRALLVVTPPHATNPLLQGFDPQFWYLKTAA